MRRGWAKPHKSGSPSNTDTFLIHGSFGTLAWHLWLCLGSLMARILHVAFFSWWVTHCSVLLITTCASKQQKRCFYSWIGSLSLLQAKQQLFPQQIANIRRIFQAGSGILNNSRSPKFLSLPPPKNPNPLTWWLISQYFSYSLHFSFHLALLKRIQRASLELHETHQRRQGLTRVPQRAGRFWMDLSSFASWSTTCRKDLFFPTPEPIFSLKWQKETAILS